MLQKGAFELKGVLLGTNTSMYLLTYLNYEANFTIGLIVYVHTENCLRSPKPKKLIAFSIAASRY